MMVKSRFLSMKKISLIHIDVIDNGLGMPPETIDISCTIKWSPANVVLASVYEMLMREIKLIFGNAYGVVITSELDEGTTASIIIPKIKKVEDIGY